MLLTIKVTSLALNILFFFIKVELQLDLPLFVKRQTLVIEAGNLSVPEISVIRNAFFTSADYIRRSHVFR